MLIKVILVITLNIVKLEKQPPEVLFKIGCS